MTTLDKGSLSRPSRSLPQLTQQPVLHNTCAMYPTCTIWTPLLAGNLSEQCRIPSNNPPFNLYWAFKVAQQEPQTLSRCLADAETLHYTSALQTFSSPIRPFDRLCLLLTLLIRSVDGCGLLLHTSGFFPFLTHADHFNFFALEYQICWPDVCLSTTQAAFTPNTTRNCPAARLHTKSKGRCKLTLYCT